MKIRSWLLSIPFFLSLMLGGMFLADTASAQVLTDSNSGCQNHYGLGNTFGTTFPCDPLNSYFYNGSCQNLSVISTAKTSCSNTATYSYPGALNQETVSETWGTCVCNPMETIDAWCNRKFKRVALGSDTCGSCITGYVPSSADPNICIPAPQAEYFRTGVLAGQSYTPGTTESLLWGKHLGGLISFAANGSNLFENMLAKLVNSADLGFAVLNDGSFGVFWEDASGDEWFTYFTVDESTGDFVMKKAETTSDANGNWTVDTSSAVTQTTITGGSGTGSGKFVDGVSSADAAYGFDSSDDSDSALASDGEVGVGTKNPQAKFHVVGDFLLDKDPGGGGEGGKICTLVTGTLNSGVFTPNGSTGTGTDEVSVCFDMSDYYDNSSTTYTCTLVGGTQLCTVNYFGDNPGGGSGSSKFVDGVSSTDAAYGFDSSDDSDSALASDGEVGVGTKSPESKFHVVGDITLDKDPGGSQGGKICTLVTGTLNSGTFTPNGSTGTGTDEVSVCFDMSSYYNDSSASYTCTLVGGKQVCTVNYFGDNPGGSGGGGSSSSPWTTGTTGLYYSNSSNATNVSIGRNDSYSYSPATLELLQNQPSATGFPNIANFVADTNSANGIGSRASNANVSIQNPESFYSYLETTNSFGAPAGVNQGRGVFWGTNGRDAHIWNQFDDGGLKFSVNPSNPATDVLL